MLALDGGGIRGVLSIEVLSAIEQQLRKEFVNERLVLADYFDYIAGTSTGAIIAAALAIGKSVDEVRSLYEGTARHVFVKRFLGRFKMVATYGRQPLEKALRDVFGMESLGSEVLKTMLMVVVRNVTTDSAWPVSSNIHARYNKRGLPDCNLDLPLWRLVRASTAAPTFFAPEVVPMPGLKGTKRFVFADGGTTAYNNPAFLLYRMATEEAYWHAAPGSAWKRGEDDLLLVSVGTGLSPLEGPDAAEVDRPQLLDAIDTLRSFVYQTTVDQDISCRMVGRCCYGGLLDSEIEKMMPTAPTKRDFSYVRYNVDLTAKALRDELDLGHIEPHRVSPLDAVEAIPELQEIGQALAKRVSLREHFPRVFLPTVATPKGNGQPSAEAVPPQL
jgi:hypothetical protein